MTKAVLSPKKSTFVGRRKESTARVILADGTGRVTINKKDYKVYFSRVLQQLRVLEPLKLCNAEKAYDVVAIIKGGGITGQSDALRLAISKALVEKKPDFEPILKKAKLLTRDSRMIERKKYGRHKARRGHQFSKR